MKDFVIESGKFGSRGRRGGHRNHRQAINEKKFYNFTAAKKVGLSKKLVIGKKL